MKEAKKKHRKITHFTANISESSGFPSYIIGSLLTMLAGPPRDRRERSTEKTER